MEMNMQNIIAQIKGITASGLPFMEGLEKGETQEILGQIVNVDEFGFMNGDDGEYVVFTIKENEDNFFFGSTVVTSAFKQLDANIQPEVLKEILELGLPIKLTERQSKSKRKYIKVDFYPNN